MNSTKPQKEHTGEIESIIKRIYDFRLRNPLEWVNMGYMITRYSSFFNINKSSKISINFSLATSYFAILNIDFLINRQWTAEYIVTPHRILEGRTTLVKSIDTNYRIGPFSFKQAIRDLIEMNILNDYYHYVFL